MDRKKFKSGLSLSIFVALVIYHIMVILPFFLKHYLEKDVITWCAYVLLGLDVVFFLPLIFNTYYSLEETYLFVHQWPFSRLKINYSDIFIIDNELPEDAGKKNIKKYGFTNKKVIIGYYSEVLDRKEKKTKKVKKYVFITPSDYDAFMIRIGGKFTVAKQLAQKLEQALKNAQDTEEKSEPVKEKIKKEKKEKAVSEKVHGEKKETSAEEVAEKSETPLQDQKTESQQSENKAEDTMPEEKDNGNIIIAKGVKSAKIKIVDDDKK